MTDAKKFYRKLLSQLSTGSLVLLLVASVLAQVPSSQPQTPAPQQQKSPGGPPVAAPDSKTAGEAARTTHEPKISPKEAEELFRSVDEILHFVSKDSALPIKHEVKRKLTSRDEVVAYLEKGMREDKGAQRLRRSELVLKKFGLLPRAFNLEASAVAVLREQIAGYYDPKTKTMNLLDWVPVDQQRPVLAHELTHALQDESFGLEKWMKAHDVDLDNKDKLTPDDIERDEGNETREAVVEGQAEAVMLDYVLAPAGRSLSDSPDVLADLQATMLSGTPDSVEFKNAPVFLKESLTFPYRYGVAFVVALLKNGGRDKAFAGTFTKPPRTTRQIMEPKTYLSGERVEPMRLPDFKQIFKNYDRFDVGAVGEFDVSVLIDQYASVDASHDLYPHWRGGYYYAARPKGDPSAPLGLLYVSRWSDAERSAEFAAIYAKSLSKRYRRVQEVADADQNPLGDLQVFETLSGKHTWMTEEGPIVIHVEGDTVLVTESLDTPTTEKLRQELFGTVAAAK